MKLLFLDDSEDRWILFKRNTIGVLSVWVKTADECIGALDGGDFTHVFLDHDLEEGHYGYAGSPTGTGYDVVRFLTKDAPSSLERFKDVMFYVHSLNPDGAKRMTEELAKAGFTVLQAPFVWRDIKLTSKEEEADGPTD